MLHLGKRLQVCWLVHESPACPPSTTLTEQQISEKDRWEKPRSTNLDTGLGWAGLGQAAARILKEIASGTGRCLLCLFLGHGSPSVSVRIVPKETVFCLNCSLRMYSPCFETNLFSKWFPISLEDRAVRERGSNSSSHNSSAHPVICVLPEPDLRDHPDPGASIRGGLSASPAGPEVQGCRGLCWDD